MSSCAWSSSVLIGHQLHDLPVVSSIEGMKGLSRPVSVGLANAFLDQSYQMRTDAYFLDNCTIIRSEVWETLFKHVLAESEPKDPFKLYGKFFVRLLLDPVLSREGRKHIFGLVAKVPGGDGCFEVLRRVGILQSLQDRPRR